jgi:hypothetical protein
MGRGRARRVWSEDSTKTIGSGEEEMRERSEVVNACGEMTERDEEGGARVDGVMMMSRPVLTSLDIVKGGAERIITSSEKGEVGIREE